MTSRKRILEDNVSSKRPRIQDDSDSEDNAELVDEVIAGITDESLRPGDLLVAGFINPPPEKIYQMTMEEFLTLNSNGRSRKLTATQFLEKPDSFQYKWTVTQTKNMLNSPDTPTAFLSVLEEMIFCKRWKNPIPCSKSVIFEFDDTSLFDDEEEEKVEQPAKTVGDESKIEEIVSGIVQFCNSVCHSGNVKFSQKHMSSVPGANKSTYESVTYTLTKPIVLDIVLGKVLDNDSTSLSATDALNLLAAFNAQIDTPRTSEIKKWFNVGTLRAGDTIVDVAAETVSKETRTKKNSYVLFTSSLNIAFAPAGISVRIYPDGYIMRSKPDKNSQYRCVTSMG